MPSTTLPKTTCFPSSQGVSAVQRKNCDPVSHIKKNRRLTEIWIIQMNLIIRRSSELEPLESTLTIGIGTRIGHAEDSRAGMCQREVFVFKATAINGFASSTVVIREISTLTHETWDNPMEGGTSVAKPLLSRTQLTEILSGLGYDVGAELHDKTPSGLVADGDVKVTLGVRHSGF
mmetsp:Transcript_12741/g.27556  ORF Transcript_12741/g.27556 Transcript_12741/m.27556 type:complete len:176 (-) Transcript_12741:75-602(-)